MFVSDYNRFAFQFVDNYDYSHAPQVTMIIGSEGLGKTALLEHLIHNITKKVNNTLLIDAQKFSSKYSFAACNGQLSYFRRKMRSCKLLLFDNIDKLKGKKKTIEELFYTLDTILAGGGKAVFTFNGENLSLDYLGERLASRLRSGFIIRLREPATEELSGFLDYYLTQAGLPLPVKHEALLIADKKVLCSGAKTLRHVIENVVNIREKLKVNDLGQNCEALLQFLSVFYGIEGKKILGGSKIPIVVEARYWLYLLLHEIYYHSYKEIARHFKKNEKLLEKKCLGIKESNPFLFDVLCRKLYNHTR